MKPSFTVFTCSVFTKPVLSVFLFSLLFLGSCVTQRDVEYLQNLGTSATSFTEAKVEDYKLKTNDELYIQISSLDDQSANMFTGTGGQQAFNMGTIEPYGASLISYSIDKEGYLILPVIGRIQVVGKTTTEVSELLKDSLRNVLSQPVISVKLVNRYVTVIGEVQRPGHYVFAQEKLTVFDAIGLAGDITDYGNRRDVVLTRNENGQNILIPLDLTKPEILAAGYYYLRPNDIVYVKPLSKKFWGLRQFPYAVLLSTITTAILVYSVIKP